LFSPPRVKAEIKISVPPNVGNVIVLSLKPELDTPTSDRSEVSLDPTTSGILIKIEAEDITALRAAANSYLYWVRAIIEISDKIKEKNS
jgi:tRNA threonylcarbamoyladenosine modification (KEOPS) complex  Pcc1 subunit